MSLICNSVFIVISNPGKVTNLRKMTLQDNQVTKAMISLNSMETDFYSNINLFEFKFI